MSCTSEFSESALFSSNPGKVVAFDGPATPFTFSVDGLSTFHHLKGIITSIGLQAQSGFQFMHALREFIYVYVFTERMGEMIISGLVFPEYCDNAGTQSIGNCTFEGQTGIERVIAWYECNRITSRIAPITIIIGSTIVYDGFLVGMKVDIANAETGIAQFSFRFNFVPVVVDSDGICFPFDEDCLDFPCPE